MGFDSSLRLAIMAIMCLALATPSQGCCDIRQGIMDRPRLCPGFNVNFGSVADSRKTAGLAWSVDYGVKPTCKSGYAAMGNVSCLADGSWSFPSGMDQAQFASSACSVRGICPGFDVNHGSVPDTTKPARMAFSTNHLVTPTCQPGFEVTANVSCMGDGKWVFPSGMTQAQFVSSVCKVTPPTFTSSDLNPLRAAPYLNAS
ncbi:uncharacterized protein LOC135824384 [Sycon ciliatum]|uniref:uncharacterized protein LOC135824384 n=1 Tax=Sycon ciliatum TaxID=27933 RepID=UPI0031F6D3DC